MVQGSDFDRSADLPPGLTITAIRKAIEYVERDLADFVEVYLEQANVFSALVGIFATKALDANSVYEKHRHTDVAQTRFPDLKKRGSGPDPSPNHCLECKASKRPWAVQSHYDHPGWYIIWRYLVDPTCSLEPGKPVIIWRVDVAFFESSDWKYEGSGAGAEGGGRTHTFGIKRPATRLKDKAVYSRSDVAYRTAKQYPGTASSTDCGRSEPSVPPRQSCFAFAEVLNDETRMTKGYGRRVPGGQRDDRRLLRASDFGLLSCLGISSFVIAHPAPWGAGPSVGADSRPIPWTRPRGW